ncbi:histidine kinase [Paraflavisolibacter sp. H34]|uniref:sensor histidine kinase n=1 Tax=Huijunlia imazamoxiresistens TaxID=3127457 RepID=UPI00301789FE
MTHIATYSTRMSGFFYSLFGFRKATTGAQLSVIILAHMFIWLLFLCLPLLFYPLQLGSKVFLYRAGVDKLFIIGFFYYHHYYLVPRLFLVPRKSAYFLSLLLSLVVVVLLHLLVEHLFRQYFLKGTEAVPRFLFPGGHLGPGMPVRPFDPLGGRGFPPDGTSLLGVPLRVFFMLLRNALSSFLMLLFISCFLHVFFSLVRTQNEKKALENAHLHAEINLLRSQIHPHFLFNTLNSIYAQAVSRPEQAQQSILKLSEILRYMLYETSSEKISLEKDVQYLSSYIDLQRMRLSQKITIHYTVRGGLKGLTIAPLLLITFVENAFKHGISYSPPSTISIHLEVVDNALTLLVRNPVVGGHISEPGGMGLQNARRRLELLYPRQYWLEIEENKNQFVVNLKILLT